MPSVKLQKESRELLFETRLSWLSQQTGVLSAPDADGFIHVATPAAFGGQGSEWSPEQLFLGALSSCFMTTFLFFSKKMGFVIADFECKAVGRVELKEGKYQFTRIDIFPKISVDNLAYENAGTAMEKTQQYCLVSNSVRAEIVYHGEVITSTSTAGNSKFN